MYYEIYIDVLFLENFLINSLLLLIVKRLEKASGGKGRVFLGGAAGAISTCLLVVSHMPLIIEYLLTFLVVDVCMIWIAIGIQNATQMFRILLLFWMTTLMAGSIFNLFRPYLRSMSLFYFLTVIMYFFVRELWEIILCFKKQQRNILKVTIITVNGKVCVKALEDTGNQLYDPISKEPVSVIGNDVAKILLGCERVKEEMNMFSENLNVRYIPFHTISGSGMLPVLRAEKMILHMREERSIERPLIGISSEPVSKRQLYQMILNSDILGGAKNVSESGSTTAV
ncbi:MAG: sigma-E processing peptidase SpoIIGA [Ruminococcus sp.]|nr:sigma-E processing peptidase SpoIIGA [Ruminococcus sp.]